MKISFQQIFVLSSLTFLAVFSYVFYFLHNEVKANNTAAEEANIAWREEEYKQEEIKVIARGIKAVESGKKELEKHFVHNSDLVPFLDTVEGLALKVGALTETMAVDVSFDGQSLTVGMRAKGSLESVYKYILLLENSPYELEISSLDMRRESLGEASAVPAWQADIGIKLLSFTN